MVFSFVAILLIPSKFLNIDEVLETKRIEKKKRQEQAYRDQTGEVGGTDLRNY